MAIIGRGLLAGAILSEWCPLGLLIPSCPPDRCSPAARGLRWRCRGGPWNDRRGSLTRGIGGSWEILGFRRSHSDTPGEA